MSTKSTEKSNGESEKRLIEAIEKKHGKSVDQLRMEREKRIREKEATFIQLSVK